MTSLCTERLNGLDQIGLAGKGWQGRRFIDLQEVAHLVLSCIQARELSPGQGRLEVPPDPLNGVEFWAVGRQEHQAHVRGADESLGPRRPTVVEEQESQAVGEALRERIDEELEALGVQIREFAEGALARGRLDRAVHIEPREDVLPRTAGWHSTRREAPAPDRQEAEPTLVWAEHPEGMDSGRRDRLLELFMTGRVECGDGLRGFLCGAGEPL